MAYIIEIAAKLAIFMELNPDQDVGCFMRGWAEMESEATFFEMRQAARICATLTHTG
jgi:hypothetical protein